MRAVDTLNEFRKLVAAGYSEQQAEAQVRLVAESVHLDMDVVATKKDLENLEAANKHHIGLLQAETKNSIEKLIIDMNHKFKYVWVMGSLIFVACILPFLSKLSGN